MIEILPFPNGMPTASQSLLPETRGLNAPVSYARPCRSLTRTEWGRTQSVTGVILMRPMTRETTVKMPHFLTALWSHQHPMDDIRPVHRICSISATYDFKFIEPEVSRDLRYVLSRPFHTYMHATLWVNEEESTLLNLQCASTQIAS